MMEQVVNIDRMEQVVGLFGSFDTNIRTLENEYHVTIVVRDGELRISGEAEQVALASRAVMGLLNLLQRGETLNDQNIRYVISLVNEGNEDKLEQLCDQDCICITAKGRPVKPKTLGQTRYIEAIKKNTIVLGVGPAGTGKTYLAVAMAVTAFRAQEVNRIILTRPAVEAGEKLGFLPGDLQQKVDPYLRPLYDALFDMLGAENFRQIPGAGQYRGGSAGLYARAHPRRQLHHPRRGAEHHPGADENVSDPVGFQFQDGGHRRHHPDRPARWAAFGAR